MVGQGQCPQAVRVEELPFVEESVEHPQYPLHPHDTDQQSLLTVDGAQLLASGEFLRAGQPITQ